MEQSKSLSLVELLNVANEAYDDGYLAEYFDPDTGGHPKQVRAILSPTSSFGKSATLLTRTLPAVRSSRKPGAFSGMPSMTLKV
jgi:hypothetical protein